MADEPNPNNSTISAMKMRKPALNRERAKQLYFVLAIFVAVAVLGYGGWLIFGAGRESTDDAQTAGDVVAIAARVGGEVVRVDVSENQRVKSGDVIAEIDPSDATVALEQAKAELETARAQAAEADARVGVAGAAAHGGLSTAQAAVAKAHEALRNADHAIAEAEAAVAKARANAERARLDNDRAIELGRKGDIARAQMDAAKAASEAANADLDQAEARLRSAKSARALAEASLGESRGKLEQSSPVDAQIDAAQSAARLAHARVKAAAAAVEKAKLALSRTRIVAPADGIASNFSVHAGSLVVPGEPIVQLVPLRTYVVANFKETQVRNMKPGQRAKVEVDALSGKNFEGTVESMSSGTGASFSLLPPDNASGNFVKVVQRIPVRIEWDGPESDRVPVGSSVEVTVYTKSEIRNQKSEGE